MPVAHGFGRVPTCEARAAQAELRAQLALLNQLLQEVFVQTPGQGPDEARRPDLVTVVRSLTDGFLVPKGA